MLALAAALTVADGRREYAEVYRELRANGYTAVGEFHYLGFDEALAAAEAAAEAGVELTLLYACYLRGGIPASGKSRLPTTSPSSNGCAARGSGSGSPPTPCAPAPPR